jgi:hypothetical protein
MLVTLLDDPGLFSNSRAPETGGPWPSDRAVSWWLSSRLEDLARHAGTVKQRDRAHARAVARSAKAKILIEKLTREKIATARLHAAGDLTLPAYEEAKRQNQAELDAASEAQADALTEAERLAPVQDVYEALIRLARRPARPRSLTSPKGRCCPPTTPILLPTL